MPSRSFVSTTFNKSDYRFGFNGKEADRNGEWGSRVHYDYGFRIYDPGIGKFLSVDPLTASYPMLTPYQFASNSPIANIDLDGLEHFYAADGEYLGKYGESTEIRVLKSHENQNYLPMIINNPNTPQKDIDPFIGNSVKGYLNPDQAAGDFVNKYNGQAHMENQIAGDIAWKEKAGRNRKEFGAAILSKETVDGNNNPITIYVIGSENSGKTDNKGSAVVTSSSILSDWEINHGVHTDPIIGENNGETFSPYRNNFGIYGDEYIAKDMDLYLGTPKGYLKVLRKGTKNEDAIILSNEMPHHPYSGRKGKPSFKRLFKKETGEIERTLIEYPNPKIEKQE